MNLQSLTPNLMVKNVNQSIEFYSSVFGFEKITTVPESGTFIWAMIQLGNVQIMLQAESSIKEEYPTLNKHAGGGALTFYIRVTDINALYKVVKEKVNLVKPLGKTPYGANEFAIADPDGFIFTFSDIVE